MGGESRSRKRSSSSSEDEKERSEKRRRKEKKSHKHRSHKEKKEKKKSKHKSDRRGAKLDIQELSKDDYFAKNNEFATWLKEEKNVFFSDLSSESAREMFSDFIKAWNNQKLEYRYYEGITSAPRSAHNWNIKK